jgi:Domain of unknown function (DUF4331)
MSSHREAPQISKDPTADSTDVYAFVSPDSPSTVTLIANYIPLQAPDGGPNFYEFADDLTYEIKIDNDGDGLVDIAYEFNFKTVNNIPTSFLYNDGPITKLTKPSKSSTWNRQQTFTLTRVDWTNKLKATRTVLGTELLVPPCNIGPLSTPNYAKTFLPAAISSFKKGKYSGKVFAGQRAEGFYVDLGSVFDLADLRGFAGANVYGKAAGLMSGMPGVNSTADVNVHSLAIQVPITNLTRDGKKPAKTTSSNAVIGVWTACSRKKVQINEGTRGKNTASGPWVQVSRLGNPLVNELLIALEDKDYWNAKSPLHDSTLFFKYFANPLLPQLLPTLYPGVFPNLAAYNAKHKGTTKKSPARPDLVAILLSGVPNSVASALKVPPTNVGGTGLADHLRLNVAQPPTAKPNSLGWLGGDPAGFPNGRRVFDDVATIELRAVAGATLPLVDPAYKADGAAAAVDFGLTNGSDGTDLTAKGSEDYLTSFPYLGTPYSGYATPAATPAASTG